MKAFLPLLTPAILSGSASAATVFTDTFNYTTNNAFVAEGGWTAVIQTGGAAMGSDAGSGIFWGNPLGGTAALEYQYAPTLNLGDIISMDADLNRPFLGYYYGKEILLWNGSNTGTITSRTDESQQGNVLTTTTYTVTQADLNAGLNHVIFRYSHDGNWGETNSVTFAITSVPEPGTAALLGLVGMTSLVRRRR